jgi:hypothetical protein
VAWRGGLHALSVATLRLLGDATVAGQCIAGEHPLNLLTQSVPGICKREEANENQNLSAGKMKIKKYFFTPQKAKARTKREGKHPSDTVANSTNHHAASFTNQV